MDVLRIGEVLKFWQQAYSSDNEVHLSK